MFSGKVPAKYARAHHEKRYWEKVKEEMEWEEEVARQIEGEAKPAPAKAGD